MNTNIVNFENKTNNTKEAIEARRAAFEATQDNAKDDCWDNNGNVIVKAANISADLLWVDPRYQGDRDHKKTNNLASHWDWKQYDHIRVVAHPETCQYAIVDGQNRFDAGCIKGIKKFPARIIIVDSKDEEERLKVEANWFIHQDDNVEKVKAVEKHKARLLNGDKEATVLQNALDRFKISYTSGQGRRYGRVLGSYIENLDIARIHGEDCLNYIYLVIENAKWADELDGYATPIIRALRDAWKLHDTEEERVKTASFLGMELKKYKPSEFMTKARAKYPTRDARMATEILVDDILTEAGIVERSIYPIENNKIKAIKTSDKVTA